MSDATAIVETGTQIPVAAQVDDRSPEGFSPSVLAMITARHEALTAKDAPVTPAPVAAPVVEAAPAVVAAPEPVAEVPTPEPVAPYVDPRFEELSRLEALRDLYEDDRGQAVTEAIAYLCKVPKDSPDLAAHLVRSITLLSSKLAGIESKPTQAEIIDRAVKTNVKAVIDTWKQDQHAADEKKAQEAETTRLTEENSRQKLFLREKVFSPHEHAALLKLAPEPEQAVLNLIAEELAKGNRIDFVAGAKLAEKLLREHITIPVPEKPALQQPTQHATPAAPVLDSKQPSTPIISHRAPTLSNADASSVVTTPLEEPTTHEEAIERTIRRAEAYRAQLSAR